MKASNLKIKPKNKPTFEPSGLILGNKSTMKCYLLGKIPLYYISTSCFLIKTITWSQKFGLIYIENKVVNSNGKKSAELSNNVNQSSII